LISFGLDEDFAVFNISCELTVKHGIENAFKMLLHLKTHFPVFWIISHCFSGNQCRLQKG